MAKINIKGDIIYNEWKKYYDHYGWDGVCPRDVQTIIDKAEHDEPLDVYINSPGGIVEAGQEIYTALRGDPRVNIHITGQACSAASFIAMAGHSDISPVGLLMVHCASVGFCGGNHNDFQKVADALTVIDKAIANAYVTKSGMELEKAIRLMERETWLTANQCVEYGLIDEITPVDAPTAPSAAAAYGEIRLTKELIEKAENEMKELENRKNALIEDLDDYGV